MPKSSSARRKPASFSCSSELRAGLSTSSQWLSVTSSVMRSVATPNSRARSVALRARPSRISWRMDTFTFSDRPGMAAAFSAIERNAKRSTLMPSASMRLLSSAMGTNTAGEMVLACGPRRRASTSKPLVAPFCMCRMGCRCGSTRSSASASLSSLATWRLPVILARSVSPNTTHWSRPRRLATSTASMAWNSASSSDALRGCHSTMPAESVSATCTSARSTGAANALSTACTRCCALVLPSRKMATN